MPTPKNNQLDNTKKSLIVAGVPISVTGGIMDGDGVVITPGGPRRVLVRGLYGDAVWVKQANGGHWILVINTMEISEMNTILYNAQIGDAVLPIQYKDGWKTTRAGNFMVMTDPELKISNTLVPHAYTLESADFIGTIGGRTI